MRISVAVSLFLALGFIHPVSMSSFTLPGDAEGSGHDLDSSGSGSGDWSDQDEIIDMKVQTYSKDKTSGTDCHWPAINIESEFVVVGNSKSLLERKEVITGIIAGGVTGVMLAAILAGVLIYIQQKKSDGGYILGHREEVVV